MSLHGGVVGKGPLALEQLSNGRFASYVSNNEYDIGIVVDLIRLLQRLDEFVRKANGQDADGGDIRVAPEAMHQVRLQLNDFAAKATTIRMHLKDSLALLNSMCVDNIERLLLGSAMVVPVEDANENNNDGQKDSDSTNTTATLLNDGKEACPSCGKRFKHLNRHMCTAASHLPCSTVALTGETLELSNLQQPATTAET